MNGGGTSTDGAVEEMRAFLQRQGNQVYQTFFETVLRQIERGVSIDDLHDAKVIIGHLRQMSRRGAAPEPPQAATPTPATTSRASMFQTPPSPGPFNQQTPITAETAPAPDTRARQATPAPAPHVSPLSDSERRELESFRECNLKLLWEWYGEREEGEAKWAMARDLLRLARQLRLLPPREPLAQADEELLRRGADISQRFYEGIYGAWRRRDGVGQAAPFAFHEEICAAARELMRQFERLTGSSGLWIMVDSLLYEPAVQALEASPSSPQPPEYILPVCFGYRLTTAPDDPDAVAILPRVIPFDSRKARNETNTRPPGGNGNTYG